MVICKYYRQGNCRYGQYCQFEHINHFGTTKTEDDIIILVAKEVLLAERGGQWLLSCFAPLRDRPCIPGMEDLSSEEVRWDIYQAQKNGMVEQAKLRFQQLCQDMKAKREVLKNPTRETVTLLKKILGNGQKGGLNASDNTARKSSALSFTASQLALANNTSTNNVFGNATFGVQNNNPFGGGGFTSSNNALSIFGKSTNNTPSVFGGGVAFGNNLGGFGTATNGTASIFGSTNTSASFGNSVQNSAPTFGTPQNNSIFSGSSQNVFGQNNNPVFGGTGQLGNTSTTSLFNNPITSQASTSLFGGATTTASSLFGSSSTGLQTNSVFGTSTTSSSGSFNSGMFTQPKTQIPAFGGAPVFGGATSNYASNSAGSSIFGGGQTFGAPAISTNNIFGGSTATPTLNFGSIAATTTPAFGTSVVAATTPGFGAPAATATAFDLSQQPSNNTTFGTTVSAPNIFSTQNTDTTSAGNAPFGASPAAISGPFVTTSSQQFDSTSASSAPFAGAGFGMAVASSTFGTTETSSNSIFANAGTTFATSNGTVSNPSPFPASAFGNINTSPFSSTAGTNLTTTTTANPFAPRTQQNDSPFGGVAQNQSYINASPFGKSPFNITAPSNGIIDDSVYSADDVLTDDEKSMFLAEKFIIGKIPLKPPTKDIR